MRFSDPVLTSMLFACQTIRLQLKQKRAKLEAETGPKLKLLQPESKSCTMRSNQQSLGTLKITDKAPVGGTFNTYTLVKPKRQMH